MTEDEPSEPTKLVGTSPPSFHREISLSWIRKHVLRWYVDVFSPLISLYIKESTPFYNGRDSSDSSSESRPLRDGSSKRASDPYGRNPKAHGECRWYKTIELVRLIRPRSNGKWPRPGDKWQWQRTWTEAWSLLIARTFVIEPSDKGKRGPCPSIIIKSSARRMFVRAGLRLHLLKGASSAAILLLDLLNPSDTLILCPLHLCKLLRFLLDVDDRDDDSAIRLRDGAYRTLCVLSLRMHRRLLYHSHYCSACEMNDCHCLPLRLDQIDVGVGTVLGQRPEVRPPCIRSPVVSPVVSRLFLRSDVQ